MRLCRDAGLLRSERVALDGTKIQANASKRKAMSYGRMKKKLTDLDVEIEALMGLAEAADQAEDAQYGAGQRGDVGVVEAVQHARSRREWIAQRMAELEEETRLGRAAELERQAQSNEASAVVAPNPSEARRRRTTAKKRKEASLSLFGDDDPPPAEALPRNVPPHHRDGTPKDRAQRNSTDPDSRIMKKDGAFLQAYNGQLVVDEETQVAVAAGVSNLAPDVTYLPEMLARTCSNLGASPVSLTTDAGYWSAGNAELCEELGVEPYIATSREMHGMRRKPTRIGPPPPELGTKERMQWRIETAEGLERVIRRRTSSEPVFGQIKEARTFRRFSLRGMDKIRGEWDLIAAAHNLVKLWRAT